MQKEIHEKANDLLKKIDDVKLHITYIKAIKNRTVEYSFSIYIPSHTSHTLRPDYMDVRFLYLYLLKAEDDLASLTKEYESL